MHNRRVKPRLISDLLGIFYTFNCPIQCDFCCFPPELYGYGKMNPDHAVDYILQAGEISTVTSVAFSGGEPFLYYEEILDICEKVKKTRIPFRIVTNCYWSSSYLSAMKKLQTLKSLGMNLLGVSCDYSHQKYVPLKNVENAIKAALDIGLWVEVVGTFWNNSDKVENLIILPKDNPKIKITNIFVLPAGRAQYTDITPSKYGLVPTLEKFRCGGKNKYDIAIFPNGDVYPCCSGGWNIAGKLSKGNMTSSRLSEIIDKIHADIFIRIAKEKSFKVLYDLICYKNPDLHKRLPEYKDKVSACQICSQMHSNDKLMGEIEPYLEEYEITYVLEELCSWKNQFIKNSQLNEQ